MKLRVVQFCFVMICGSTAIAQPKQTTKDSAINNLVLPNGYISCEYGSIPEFKKAGTGKKVLILIPGLGFDATVFDDFMEANKGLYTMYAVTIAGYGSTKAPPMPQPGTSYGDQTWNKSFEEGLIKLIDKERLQKPIIAGHFVQGAQLALRLAIDYPNKVSGLIILGGPAKFVAVQNGKAMEFSLKGSIDYVDKNLAPSWFKSMSRQSFNDGNFLPAIYSLDTSRGAKLWKLSASAALPIMVRYSSEYFASDVTLETEKIQCPVLVLRAMYNANVIGANNYLKPQFIDSWDKVVNKNPLFIIKDIIDAASFVWKDKPWEVYEAIEAFVFKKK